MNAILLSLLLPQQLADSRRLGPALGFSAVHGAFSCRRRRRNRSGLAPPVPTAESNWCRFVLVPGHIFTSRRPSVLEEADRCRLPLAGPTSRKTYNSKNRITFDYGRTQVVLIFRLIGGKVDVPLMTKPTTEQQLRRMAESCRGSRSPRRRATGELAHEIFGLGRRRRVDLVTDADYAAAKGTFIQHFMRRFASSSIPRRRGYPRKLLKQGASR